MPNPPAPLQTDEIASEVPEQGEILRGVMPTPEPDNNLLILGSSETLIARIAFLEAENHNLRVALKDAEESAMDKAMDDTEGINLAELSAAASAPMEPELAKYTNEAIAKGMALSPEDAAALRAIVEQQNPAVELPDGSLRVTITVPEEMLVPLREWADGAGEPFLPYLQTFLVNSLYATVMGANVG